MFWGGDDLKRKSIIISQLIIAVLYFSTYFLTLPFAGLILTLHHFIAAFIILGTLSIHRNFKLNWVVLASVPISMAIGSLIKPISHYMYLASILLLLITIINYFAKNIKRWHRAQLILDILIMMIMILGVTSAVFLSKFDAQALTSSQWVTLTTILVADLLTLLMILVLISSTTLSKISVGLYMVVVGMCFYVLNNLIGIYNDYMVLQIGQSIPNLFRIFAFSLFAIGSQYENKKMTLKKRLC